MIRERAAAVDDLLTATADERTEQMDSGPDLPAGPGTTACLKGKDLTDAAFHGTDALVLVLGADGRALAVNRALTTATGWTEDDVMSTPFWDLYVVPEDVPRARAAFRRSIDEGLAFPQEGDWRTRSGARRRISMQNSVLRDEDGRPYAVVTVGVDVSEQRRQEAALRERARTDPLTGLHNRRGLFEVLEAAPAAQAEVGYGMLFCDLDGFKQANDEHGHGHGDLLLVEVADRLRRVVGERDLVARFGGDEFVVLCPDAGEDRLAVLASVVEQAVDRPFEVGGRTVALGISVGAAVGAAGADPGETIRVADRSMYRIKSVRRAGRRG